MKPRVLVICFNNLKNDARVMRQIDFLKDSYDLTIFCYDAYPSPDYELFKVAKTKLTTLRKALLAVSLILRFDSFAYKLLYDYDRYVDDLKRKSFQLVVANDIETLPLGVKVATRESKLFLDAHEYAPRQFEDRLYWRIFFKRFTMQMCKKYIPMVDGMSTINNGLAAAYEAQFSVKPIVVTNATNYVDLKPRPRETYPIRLVHHGIFTISRQPDIMIDLMNLLDDRFTLDLIYLIPDSASQSTRAAFESFQSRAIKTGKIRILPPLKGHEIVPTLHQNYDMGIILVPPINFNYENGLPNKLFDCIQARLAMAVGPLREIAKITLDFQIGVVSEDFSATSLAAALNSLSPEKVSEFKNNANSAALRLNAEMNKKIFLEALNEIL